MKGQRCGAICKLFRLATAGGKQTGGNNWLGIEKLCVAFAVAKAQSYF